MSIFRGEVSRKMNNRWNLSARKLENAIEKVKAVHIEASNDAYEDAHRRMEDM